MKVTGYIGQDHKSDAYVMVFVKQSKAGYTLENDSLINADLTRKMADKHFNVLEHDTERDRISVKEFNARQKENKALYTRAISVLKNNRNLLMMVIGDSAGLFTPAMNNYFSSFHSFNIPSTDWKWDYSPDKAVKAFTPVAFQPAPKDFSNRSQFVAYDSITSLSYILAVDTFGKYSWYPSDSVFYEKMIAEFNENQIVYAKDVKNSGLGGKEVLFKMNSSHNRYKRIRLVLQDSILYRLIVTGEKEMVLNENTDSLFNSMQILSGKGGKFITSPKTRVILADLASPVQNTRSEALSAMKKTTFPESNLPELIEACNKDYLSPYENTASNRVAFALAGKVAEVMDNSRKNNTVTSQQSEQLLGVSARVTALMKKADTTSAWYQIKPVIALLASIKSPEAVSILHNWLQGNKNSFLQQEIALNLIKNKEDVSAEVLHRVAADTSLRYMFYNSLKELGHADLFPKKYLNRTAMSEGLLYYSDMDDDDELIQSLTFISTREVLFRNKKYSAYLFRVVIDKTSYLGIAGGFNLSNKDVDIENDFSGIYKDGKFDPAKTDIQLKKYLRQIENELAPSNQ